MPRSNARSAPMGSYKGEHTPMGGRRVWGQGPPALGGANGGEEPASAVPLLSKRGRARVKKDPYSQEKGCPSH